MTTLLLDDPSELPYGELSPLKDIVSKTYASISKDAKNMEEAMKFFQKEEDEKYVEFLKEALEYKYKNGLARQSLIDIDVDTDTVLQFVYSSSNLFLGMSKMKGANFIGNYLTDLRKRIMVEEYEKYKKQQKEYMNKIYSVLSILSGEILSGKNNLVNYVGLNIDDILRLRYAEGNPIVIKNVDLFDSKDVHFFSKHPEQIAIILRSKYYKDYNISMQKEKEVELFSYYIDDFMKKMGFNSELKKKVEQKLVFELESKRLFQNPPKMPQLEALIDRLKKYYDLGLFPDFKFKMTYTPILESEVQMYDGMYDLYKNYDKKAENLIDKIWSLYSLMTYEILRGHNDLANYVGKNLDEILELRIKENKPVFITRADLSKLKEIKFFIDHPEKMASILRTKYYKDYNSRIPFKSQAQKLRTFLRTNQFEMDKNTVDAIIRQRIKNPTSAEVNEMEVDDDERDKIRNELFRCDICYAYLIIKDELLSAVKLNKLIELWKELREHNDVVNLEKLKQMLNDEKEEIKEKQLQLWKKKFGKDKKEKKEKKDEDDEKRASAPADYVETNKMENPERYVYRKADHDRIDQFFDRKLFIFKQKEKHLQKHGIDLKVAKITDYISENQLRKNLLSRFEKAVLSEKDLDDLTEYFLRNPEKNPKRIEALRELQKLKVKLKVKKDEEDEEDENYKEKEREKELRESVLKPILEVELEYKPVRKQEIVPVPVREKSKRSHQKINKRERDENAPQKMPLIRQKVEKEDITLYEQLHNMGLSDKEIKERLEYDEYHPYDLFHKYGKEKQKEKQKQKDKMPDREVYIFTDSSIHSPKYVYPMQMGLIEYPTVMHYVQAKMMETFSHAFYISDEQGAVSKNIWFDNHWFSFTFPKNTMIDQEKIDEKMKEFIQHRNDFFIKFMKINSFESFQMIEDLNFEQMLQLYQRERNRYIKYKVESEAKRLFDIKYKIVYTDSKKLAMPSKEVRLLLSTKNYENIVFNDDDKILGFENNFAGKYLSKLRNELYDFYQKTYEGDFMKLIVFKKYEKIELDKVLKNEDIRMYSLRKVKDLYKMMKLFQSTYVEMDPTTSKKVYYKDIDAFQFVYKNFLDCIDVIQTKFSSVFDKANVPFDFSELTGIKVTKDCMEELWKYMYYVYSATEFVNLKLKGYSIFEVLDLASDYKVKKALQYAKQNLLPLDLFEELGKDIVEFKPSLQMLEKYASEHQIVTMSYADFKKLGDTDLQQYQAYHLKELKEKISAYKNQPKFSKFILYEDVSNMPFDYTLFQTNEESQFSSLLPKHVNQINNIMKRWFKNPSLIIDATSHIGVDSVNFATTFDRALIHSYEINKDTFDLLAANVVNFRLNDRITPHHLNFLKAELPKNISFVYIDAPWGGRSYKDTPKNKFELFLSNVNIKEVARRLIVSGKTDTVVLKVPFNYRFDDLKNFNVEREDIMDGKKLSYVLLKLTMSTLQIDKCLIRKLCVSSFLNIFNTIDMWRNDTEMQLYETDIEFACHLLCQKQIDKSTKKFVLYYQELILPYLTKISLKDLKDVKILNKSISMAILLQQCVETVVNSDTNIKHLVLRILMFKQSKKITFQQSLEIDKEPLFQGEVEDDEDEEEELDKEVDEDLDAEEVEYGDEDEENEENGENGE